MFKSGGREREAGPVGFNAPAPAAGKRGMFSVLGADVVVSGNIVATADLHIDGRVEGDVTGGMLVQGADSVVVGTVTAETARIAGTVEGAVNVRELQVERSARIAGDVAYESITIETGARVEGTLKHRSKGASAAGAVTTVTQISRVAEPRLLG